MNDVKWDVEIEITPIPTDKGDEADELACGGRRPVFDVEAPHFDAAFARAKLIILGIQHNPRVFTARIISLAAGAP